MPLFERFQLFADSRRAQHDEDDDHDCLVGRQCAGNDIELEQRRGEELDDIRAEDGGPDVELAARERVAAKCNSQNRVHFDVLGHNGIVDGGEAADLDKARNGHAQAENDVGQELYELRVDTVEPRGTGVDADCLRIKPDIREPQQRPREYHADHGNENRRRNGHARQEIAVIRKRRIGDHGQFVVIDPCSNGTTGRVENQRGNHRLNFENSNERAVERAEEHRDDAAGQKCHKDRRLQRIRARIRAAQHAKDDAARNSDGGADGNILSAGGRCHKRHTDGENDKFGCVIEDCDQVARQDQIAEAVFLQRNGEERGVCDKVEYDQN